MEKITEIKSRLQTLGKEISKAETELAQCQGGMKSDLSRLKEEFEIDDEDAGTSLEKELDLDLTSTDKKIEKKYAELEEGWSW